MADNKDAKKNALARMLSKKKDVTGAPAYASTKRIKPTKTEDYSKSPSHQKFLDDMMKNQKDSSVPMYMRGKKK